MTLLNLHLGRPLTRGALTIFPLWDGHAVPARGYDLGGEHVTVAERAGDAVVAELVVTNTGSIPVLVLEGELFEGGQQHRVAARTVLVGAGASQVLDVRCVEQDRWSGAAGHARSGRRAPLSVRTAHDQAQTWERVHHFEQRYRASATGSLLEATRDAEQHAAGLVRGVRPLPFQCGVLLCLGGQPAQLESYDCPATLTAVWDALLHAAALDALALPAIPTPGRRARRFLDRISRLPLTANDAGLGQLLHGECAQARVESLRWHDRALHTIAVNPRQQYGLAA